MTRRSKLKKGGRRKASRPIDPGWLRGVFTPSGPPVYLELTDDERREIEEHLRNEER